MSDDKRKNRIDGKQKDGKAMEIESTPRSGGDNQTDQRTGPVACAESFAQAITEIDNIILKLDQNISYELVPVTLKSGKYTLCVRAHWKVRPHIFESAAGDITSIMDTIAEATRLLYQRIERMKTRKVVNIEEYACIQRHAKV